MIEYIEGKLVELNPTNAIIDVGGIGYGILISLNTYSIIEGKERIKLFIYESIREDAHLLYGFSDRHERELFVLLLSVSGVGANTARMILSSLSPNELEQALVSENASVLKNVKGIGLKTAQRIIVDLRDKIKPASFTLERSTSVSSAVMQEALAALTMLGFQVGASNKVVQKLLSENPSMRVEEVIKAALKLL